MRTFGAAAVCASAVAAGTIASSSGSATDAPTPRSTVRRSRCFLVMNMEVILSLLTRDGRLQRRRLLLERNLLHAERRAVHDRRQHRAEAVILCRGLLHDGADGGHVVPFHRPP